jgi:hypothetical protein
LKNPKILIPIIGGGILLTLAVIGVVFALRGGEPDTPDQLNEPPTVTDGTITRAQWIQRLTDAMGYNKENNADAYYTDIQAGHAAYDSVQIAVAYNLITPADRFSPDDPATREFVAVTSSKAVGLVGTPEVILTDIAGLREADSIRLAVDSGIIESIGGSFNPHSGVTVEESAGILQRIRAYMTIPIDPSHVDTVTLQDGVIDLSATTDTIYYNDSAAMSIRIVGDDAAVLEAGSVYILPSSDNFPYGVARKVRTIAHNETDGYIIENDEPDVEEVLSYIDIQGVYYPDFENAVWEDGVTGRFIEDTGLSEFSAGYGVQPLNSLLDKLLRYEVEINMAAVRGRLTINELSATAHIDTGFLRIKRATLLVEESHSLYLDMNITSSASIPLGTIPIPLGPTGLSATLKISLSASGELEIMIDDTASSEFGFNVVNNSPSVHGKALKSYQNIELMADVKVGVSFGVSLSFLGLEIAEVSAFIGAGARASTTAFLCVEVDFYIPLSLSASLFPKLRIFSGTIDIWTHSNSPIRYHWHFEDFVRVDPCTRTGIPSPEPSPSPDPSPDLSDIPDYITIRGEQYSTSLTELALFGGYWDYDEDMWDDDWIPHINNDDIEPLRYMTKLERLSIRGGEWYGQGSRVSDISPLSGLMNLKEIIMDYSNISDLTPLSRLTSLEVIDLRGNDISDISPLAGLTNLSILTLYGNQISNITPLSNLTNLTHLYLGHRGVMSGNQISDITPLSGLSRLTELDLSINLISDLTPLSGLTSLSDLSLANNQIRDITPLYSLTGLRRLGMGYIDLSPAIDTQKGYIADSQKRDLENALPNCIILWDMSPIG